MHSCTRHAYTDGQCVQHGCEGCPATLYDRELRSAVAADINRDSNTAMIVFSRWSGFAIIAVAWLLLAGMTAYGLSGPDHYYKMERRV